jgi:hyperosmotically inducible protein
MEGDRIMKPSFKFSCIAAVFFCAVMSAGCDRNKPSTGSAGSKTGQAATDVGQKAAQTRGQLNDAAITARVKTALIGETRLQALQIDVDTDNGIVTLSGEVDTPQNLDRVVQIAQTVDGVKTVENRLNVKAKA